MSAQANDLRLADTLTAESSASAVSWGSIWAGAAAAAGISLLLFTLAAGLGLASLSPWSNEGTSATTFTVMAAAVFIVIQWAASGVGGYLTGRMRTKWTALHTHEVAFRDTAHGLAMWAVATLLMAFVMSSAAFTAITGAVKATASVASTAAQVTATAASDNSSSFGGYEIDSLFRSTSATPASPEVRKEVGEILTRGLSQGDVPASDRQYLAELVAARSGISQPDAERRVTDAINGLKAAEVEARRIADASREAAATAALCTALAMLIGAFIASVAAVIGGRERDSV